MNNKKTLAYILGQVLGVIVFLCASSIVVGVTIAFLMKLF